MTEYEINGIRVAIFLFGATTGVLLAWLLDICDSRFIEKARTAPYENGLKKKKLTKKKKKK